MFKKWNKLKITGAFFLLPLLAVIGSPEIEKASKRR